jgi:hypothetical protein
MTFLSGSEGGLIFGERDENLSLFVLFDDGVYGLYAQHAKADTFEGSFTHARGPIMPSVFGQSEKDEGLTALRQSLMVASQPTPAGDPGKAAFDHPFSGHMLKRSVLFHREKGVDTNVSVLHSAQVRAQATGLRQVSFLAGNIRDLALSQEFDAIVGRLLMFNASSLSHQYSCQEAPVYDIMNSREIVSFLPAT